MKERMGVTCEYTTYRSVSSLTFFRVVAVAATIIAMFVVCGVVLLSA